MSIPPARPHLPCSLKPPHFPGPDPTLEPPRWLLGRRPVALGRPVVMAILNMTPDSFSDGGSYPTVQSAVAAAAAAAREGAEIIDLGGESTRPGAARVDEAEQIRRVVPVVRAIREEEALAGVAITVDTTRAAVAAAALDAGADGINDVSAGVEDAGMFDLAAERGAGLVLMHRLRPPESDSFSDAYREAPVYPGGVVETVRGFLAERAAAAEAAGVARGAIVVDPGLGFGKTVGQNLELIRRTGEIAALGYPVLSALSRKSFTARAAGMGEGTAPTERVAATVGLSVVQLLAGASIFRVHDVRAHVGALRAAWGAARAGATESPGGS